MRTVPKFLQNDKDGFGYTHAVNLDDGSNVWYLDCSDGQDDLIKIGGTLNYADDPYAEDPDMQNDPIYSFYAQEFLDVPDPVMTRTVHRDNNGFPASYTLNCGNTTISQLTFSHDPITGNLLSRSGMISQQETFSYDNLDRLTGVTAGNTPTMAIQYDDNGNIASKTGLGNYYYVSGGKSSGEWEIRGVDYIDTFPGETFQDKAVYYVEDVLGIPAETVEAFRAALL